MADDDGKGKDDLTPFEAARAEFIESFERLASNARKEGVRPAQAILSSWAQRGMNKLDSVFKMLEGDDEDEPKPARKQPKKLKKPEVEEE
jgi:hypothetical protein